MKPEFEGYYWVARIREIEVAGRKIEDVEELIAYFDPENAGKPWRSEGKEFGSEEFQQVNKFLGTSAKDES